MVEFSIRVWLTGGEDNNRGWANPFLFSGFEILEKVKKYYNWANSVSLQLGSWISASTGVINTLLKIQSHIQMMANVAVSSSFTFSIVTGWIEQWMWSIVTGIAGLGVPCDVVASLGIASRPAYVCVRKTE